MSREDGASVELTPLQQALLTIEKLQRKLGAGVRADDGAIAIIGMGCRFPGGASSPERFRELLWSAGDAVTDVPADRRALRGAHDAEPSTPGKTTMRRAAFVEGVDRFDAEFFRISRREAEGMDPQQRFFLEVSWEALEDAGLSPHRLAGTRTGVFAGIHARDYALVAEGGLERVGAHYSTGVDASYVAGRLSYLLGLEGPCMAVDTACSSSLVAVHLACQSLRVGESTVAIAGGVKLLLAPHLSVFLSKAGALSPSQVCRAFDRDADGMVQGEGCGVVILKRQRDAVRDGDRILATIRATAMNHDGASGGLTVPNVRAQESLYRLALERAGLEAGQVDYLEAHGTGTRLGDPIELEGISRVYGRARGSARPLWVGSVKPNIGHTEAAAGIAGLIKAVAILQSGEVPPALHFEHPTPEFAWEGSGLAVARERMSLPELGRPHRVAVSSFGMSGVNAHALLEAHREAVEAAPDVGPYLLPLSARGEAALRELAGVWSRQLPGMNLRDACFTAGAGRAHHDQRLACVAHTREELQALLRRASEGQEGEGAFQGRLKGSGGRGVVFVLGDDASLARGLMRAERGLEPSFLRHVEPLDGVFRQLMGTSVFAREAAPLRSVEKRDGVVDGMAGESVSARARGREGDAALLLICQLALAELWRSFGVEPSAVAGHGTGALSAAVIAGLLTVEEALQIVLGLPPPQSLPARPAKCPFLSFREETWVDAGAEGAVGDLASRDVPDVDLSAEHLMERNASVYLSLACETSLGEAVEAAAQRRGRDVLHGASAVGLDARHPLLTLAAKLYCAGVPLRFEHLFPEAKKVVAPTYPWQRERFWWDGEREPAKAAPVAVEDAAASEELFHEISWSPRESERTQARLDGTWLIVSEEPEATQAIRDALTDAGGEVVLARPGAAYERVSARDHRLDFTQAASFSLLLRELCSADPELRGVLFLARAENPEAPESLPRDVRVQAVAVTSLVQALARATLERPPRLCLITRGSQAVGGAPESVSLLGASLWGLGRVIAYEHPELRCLRIDVDSVSAVESSRLLVDELRRASAPPAEDDEVTLRGDRRWVPTLTQGRRTPTPAKPFRPRADRTYLITGGLGGIGLRLASWLVSHGARHLALCGRTGETPEARRVLAPLRATRAQVDVFSVDVSQTESVAALLRSVRSGGPPLGGLFHCAGVLADGSLLQLEPRSFDSVMGPKVDGAWNLHTLATEATVEQFVLFSSTASLLGAPGQGNYAAANAFLDALAHLRRARGLPAISLQWGSWAEIGMAAADARRGARLAEHGMEPMSVDAALSAMALTLAEAPVVRAIARFDVQRWTRSHPSVARSSLFRPQVHAPRSEGEPRKLREALLSLEGPARSHLMEARLKDMVAHVCRLSPERLHATDSFESLGLDSIMALELRDLVLGELDVGLPLKRFVDDGSIGQVAAELLEKLAVASVMGGVSSARADTKRVLL
ncbi:type I polyketide synthase [Myxococcus sp. K38C18041901]|uniref:type I polyketide synthase n=1 Tax=Myxococcus guangdongensis TaxID=2906760 RepID=UPI0020A72B9F|nr:type I polyketide synthase [Myxococcus guangdongensis]MCP3060222.1 type I polyketide synthase [Myxococcus guangdongensis]